MIPIKDIEGYVRALKREGFYSDYEIDCIRQKHEDALKHVRPKIFEVARKPWIRVLNQDECYVNLEVHKGKVKVKIVFPYMEIIKWNENPKNRGRSPPIDVYLRCMKLNGAPMAFLAKTLQDFNTRFDREF